MKVKQRYHVEQEVNYFNHPFAEDNTMKLVDDIGLGRSVSETSLTEEFLDNSDETINGKKKHAKERLEKATETLTFGNQGL